MSTSNLIRLRDDSHEAKEDVEMMAIIQLFTFAFPKCDSTLRLAIHSSFIPPIFYSIMASPNSDAKSSDRPIDFCSLYDLDFCAEFWYSTTPRRLKFCVACSKIETFICTGQFQSKFTPSESASNVSDE